MKLAQVNLGVSIDAPFYFYIWGRQMACIIRHNAGPFRTDIDGGTLKRE
jgi:hypothetical protein